VKFVPAAIARKIASQQLLASEHAPRALFVGGVVGMIGSTVLACRATLQLESVLDEIEHDKDRAHEVSARVNSPEYDGNATYSEKELKKDLYIITVRGGVKVVKLYAPSILLGAASIFALTKSHNILQERNLALTAAYAAVDGAYNRYRQRVIDRYGEDVDREIRYESEEVEIIDEETGKVLSTTRVTAAPGSRYARFYDEDTSRNWSPDPDINVYFLRSQQNYLNDRLKARGHVFLNEVFECLGLSHTREGAIVGWRWNKNSGDDYIDFGIWDNPPDVVKDFFNGKEGAILLDFNVDGVIYDKLDEPEVHVQTSHELSAYDR
jgi:hypothetical protein